jgi:hypothetical protein
MTVTADWPVPSCRLQVPLHALAGHPEQLVADTTVLYQLAPKHIYDVIDLQVSSTSFNGHSALVTSHLSDAMTGQIGALLVRSLYTPMPLTVVQCLLLVSAIAFKQGPPLGNICCDHTCVKLAPVRIQHLLSTVNSPNSVFRTWPGSALHLEYTHSRPVHVCLSLDSLTCII